MIRADVHEEGMRLLNDVLSHTDLAEFGQIALDRLQQLTRFTRAEIVIQKNDGTFATTLTIDGSGCS